MKPTADMLTSILHNFRVNGRFNQDQLIIGRGVDEVLTLKIGMDVPGLKTATFNNVTYYRRSDMDQLVYDPSIIKNVFGDTQTGTPTRVLYYDDGVKSWYGLPYVEGSTSIGSDQPMYKADGGTADSLEGSIWHYLTGGVDVWSCTVGEIGGVIAPTIRYTPGHASGKQYEFIGIEGDELLGTEVVLKERNRPKTTSAQTYIHPNQTTIWTSSDNDTAPQWVMFVGSDDSVAAGAWVIMYLAEGGWDLDLGTLSWLFIGNEWVDWSGNVPSCYPEDNENWSTGYWGGDPTKLTPVESEAISAKLEYTNDGTTWYPFGAGGSVNIEYEPIVFTHTDLQPDGTLKIQHDFNDFFPMCLGYTPEPRNLTFLQHQIILDYNDQNSSNLSGAVWFVNSAQSMLVSPGPDHSKITVSGAGESDINGVYTFVPEEEYSNHLDTNNTNGFTNTTMWASDNGVIFDGINGGNRMVFIYRKNPSGADVVQYVASSVDQSLEIVDVPLNKAAGSTPVPTLTWGGN